MFTEKVEVTFKIEQVVRTDKNVRATGKMLKGSPLLGAAEPNNFTERVGNLLMVTATFKEDLTSDETLDGLIDLTKKFFKLLEGIEVNIDVISKVR